MSNTIEEMDESRYGIAFDKNDAARNDADIAKVLEQIKKLNPADLEGFVFAAKLKDGAGPPDQDGIASFAGAGDLMVTLLLMAGEKLSQLLDR